MPTTRRLPPRIALLLQGTRHYERELLSGIAEYANLHGPWQFFRNVAYLEENAVDPKDLMRAWKPDAMIVRESTPHAYDAILKTRIPIIYGPSTEPHRDLPNIIVDDDAAGRMAAKHLYENGIRSFAFCGMGELFFWSRRRRQGFCNQIAELGHDVKVFESQDGADYLSWNPRFPVLKRWLSDLPPHTGIMGCNDDFTLLIQEACMAVGRNIPDDISLIGVGDDASVCELAATPLSSVSLKLKRAGYTAAEFLSKQLQGKNSKGNPARADIIIEPSHIQARRSSDPAETRDPEVAKAIAFITEQMNHPIDVQDVVEVVSLSRRSLYHRFQMATGQSISGYIRRRRLERFSRLLIETNLTISEIAYSMGYDSDTNISRLFKKHYKMSPSAFRKSNTSTTKRAVDN